MSTENSLPPEILKRNQARGNLDLSHIKPAPKPESGLKKGWKMVK